MEGSGWLQTLLGALLSLLLAMVSPAIHIVCSFTSNLNRLQSTISSVNEVASIRHVTEPFDAQMAEAEHLVRRCSAVSKWNVVMRLYYSHKLRSLETTLSRNFQNNAVVLLLLREAAVPHELQETSPDVGAEVRAGNEGTINVTTHNHGSEIEIVIIDE